MPVLLNAKALIRRADILVCPALEEREVLQQTLRPSNRMNRNLTVTPAPLGFARDLRKAGVQFFHSGHGFPLSRE